MKIKIIVSASLAVAMLGAGLTACISEKQGQAQLAGQARVSRADTERTALTKAPDGTVKEAELEKEKAEDEKHEKYDADK